ncbi:MAG: glycosyltransferase family 1 protein [Gammaproteobacteria bacterium]|nr:glycosyltransferase family 1 protein [Gammaproteobacteria bacterium]
MRLALITDAWEPQTNGVVSTLRHTCRELGSLGVDVLLVTPEGFPGVPCPSYPELRLSLPPRGHLDRLLGVFRPDAVHIATEGTLGLAARAWCLRNRRRFTTAYHTQFPEYVRARWPIPLAVSYGYLRWFHAAASATMVSTPTMRQALAQRGFRRLRHWGRGVDTELFRPRPRPEDVPVFTCLGRVAVEKNIETFLALDLPGRKEVIGDGPARADLQRRYPDAVFHGTLRGEALATRLAAASVLVFPSRTDTFGLVMLEAMACGVPVAAYPVTGPIDVITPGVTGVMDTDLRSAALAALTLDRGAVRAQTLTRSWRACALEFLSNLVPTEAAVRGRVRRWRHAPAVP